jgi:tripartite-type tricarboxylate transporter receptor subunit TctC
MGKHIPGEPAIIVKNQPGAGGQTALRLVGTMPKDGTVIAFYDPELVAQSIVNPAKVPVRHTDYAWLGSLGTDPKVCYAWGATGIKTLDDMVKRDQVAMGTSGRGGSTYTNERMLEYFFQVKLKQIFGYPGTSERRLAIERGELDGDCGSWTSVPDDWIREKRINVVLRFIRDVPGLPENVPVASDLVKDRSRLELLDFLNAASVVGRTFVVSKDVPAERIAILRSAFDMAAKDPALIAEAQKLNLIISPLSGLAVEEKLKSMSAASPATINEARDLIGD